MLSVRKFIAPLLGFLTISARAENLVTNPDFELVNSKGQAVGWENLPKNFRVEANAGENGSRGLVFENHDPDFYAFPHQKVKCVPGREYAFTVRIKTENLVNMKGQDPCATVCLEWKLDNGKNGGCYPHGFFDTKDRWKTFECLSVHIPTNVAWVVICPYVKRGVVGKAYFDGFTMTPVVRKPVSGIWSGAYRNCAAEGRVTLVAGLALKSADVDLKRTKARFRLTDDNGKAVELVPDVLADDEARVTVDVAKFPLGKSPVIFELRDKKTNRLLDGGQAMLIFDRPRELPRRKTWIDARGRLIDNGKPFFPLGMYGYMMTTGTVMETFAKGPFNCIMDYHTVGRKELDVCHRHGIRVLCNLALYADGSSFSTEINADNWAIDRIRRLKDHPALLAWYLNDERGLGMIPALKHRQELVAALDPDHPTWSVLYQIADLRHYMDTCDVLGSDPYPIPHNPIGTAAEWAKKTVIGTYAVHPVWQVPQTFDWGVYWTNKLDSTRMPTRDEMASMFWQAIACGANGLVGYSFGTLISKNSRVPFEKSWGDVCSAGAEVRRFFPMLLAGDEPPAVKSDTEGICVRAYREGKTAWLLVTNATREERVAKVRGMEGWQFRQAELGPAPLATAAADKTLSVKLPPIATAIWRF